jgi:hypothetical protein
MDLEKELVVQQIARHKRDADRAGITAIAIVACKALIIDPAGIEVAGVKLTLAKPAFLTGTLGLLLWFFVLSALRSMLVEHYYTSDLTRETLTQEIARLPAKKQFSVLAIASITNVITLLFVALIATAIAYSWRDVISLIGAAFGIQE